jgi:hypothetical protein
MTFPIPISDDKLDFLVDPSTIYGADVYLLVWSNPIVMQCRVNQTTFDKNFSEVIFDQTDATFNKGVYTDAITGYIAYFSRTNNIRDSYESLRLRKDSTATKLKVEMTSADVQNNDYVFVVKDVQFRKRKPRVGFIDSDISFQLPPPGISGIDTAYFRQLDSQSGQVDIVINPSATAVAAGASISSWALSLDGGTQIAFNSGTGATTIRYDTAGDYMPRWTVTDSNGVTQWFSPHVTIAGDDLSQAVNLNITGMNLSLSIDNGGNASIPFFDGLQNVLPGTFCAIVVKGSLDVGGNNVIFTGNIRKENNNHLLDRLSSDRDIVTFQIQGIPSQMAALKNISWLFQNETSPTTFNHLKTATMWRVVSTYLAFFSTFNNICGLSFDDTSDDFQMKEFVVPQSNYMDAVKSKLMQTNSVFDYSPAGQTKIVRHAFFIDVAARNALPTIANWQKQHYATRGHGGSLWSLERSHILRLGQVTSGGASYNTTTKQVLLLLGYAPSVVAAGGQAGVELNGQILVSDQTEVAAKSELEQRTLDAFSALQDLETFSPQVRGIFATLLSPSAAAWHTHTIDRTDNIRGYVYTQRRSLLTEITINVDLASGRLFARPRFQFEPTRLKYQALIANPPVAKSYNRPVLPTQPSLLNFPELPTLGQPTGALPELDDQPYTPQDTALTTQPTDPLAASYYTETVSGFTILAWTENSLFYATDFGYYPEAGWNASELPLQSGHTIKQAVWDRYFDTKQACYVISNNDDINDPETRVYNNRALPAIAGWSATDLNNMLATMVNATKKNNSIVYGKMETYVPAGGFPIYLLSTPIGGPANSGQGDLIGSDLTASHAGASHAVGVYNSANDWFEDPGENTSTLGGRVCDVEWPIPPGVTITQVRPTFSIRRNVLFGEGEKRYQVEIVHFDDTRTSIIIGDFGGGSSQQTITPDSGTISLTGKKILFHVSADSDIAPYNARMIGLRINGSSAADHAATRFSTDNATSFEAAQDVGLLTLGDGSMTRRIGQEVFASKDGQVRSAILAGLSFGGDADQGTTVGEHAVALLKFDVSDDYILATETKLYRIVDDVRTDITPNDGVSDGIVVNNGSLAMLNTGNNDLWVLADFGATRKVAYTNNLLDSPPTWNFNTDITNSAEWIDVNGASEAPNVQVVVADDSTIKYSVDGAANFLDRTGPASSLKGVEFL